MNRQILGFALFLAVVKIHFLLYWAFFAPVNFYSTQAPPIITVEAPSEKRICTAYKVTRKISPELQSVVIDTKRGNVTATMDANGTESVRRLSNARIHIFTEDLRYVWSGKVFAAFTLDGRVKLVSGLAPSPAVFKRNTNYYAQIECSSDSSAPNENFVYDFDEAIPAVLASGKN